MPESDRTIAISLRSLFPEAQFFGAHDLVVTSLSQDSRTCQAGDLFVAQVGQSRDGHDYVDEALARGACGILAERFVPTQGRPICVVPDARIALGKLAHALADNPTRKLKLIGVTGTNGKTTTSCLIANILSEAGHRVGILGTLGYCDSEEIVPAPLTTPDAQVLAHWLDRMVKAGCTHAVMEVSSHALALHRVAGAEFDMVCVTNVRHDHLDFHGTLANYRQAKSRIFKHLRPEGVAIVNTDDPVAASLAANVEQPMLTVGRQGVTELSAEPIERCASEQTFLLLAGDEAVPVRTSMIGDHHISNCLVAAAAGLAYNLDVKTVVRGLEATGHVPGRLQRIECGQPFSVFVDFAHTADGLQASLATLREVTEGQLICVFGAGGDRDRKKRPAMGAAVEAMADIGILTNDNPRREDPSDIAQHILSGCDHPTAMEWIPDRQAAIRRAIQSAEPGDCVLIAGKGHETTQAIGSRHFEFDDCEVVRDVLYHLEPERPLAFPGPGWLMGPN